MASWARRLAGLVGIVVLVLCAGFGVFATVVNGTATRSPPDADAIVVLTGGEDRIEAGIRLLSEGKGRRLLISGVNPSTKAREIGRLTGHDEGLFRCCIDFGYTAVSTSSNAVETRDWARRRGYSRLILVTSNYHMPRSLTEFTRVLPDAQLYSYAVGTRFYHLDAWWHHMPTMRLLATEYAKFLTSAARLAAARAMGAWGHFAGKTPATVAGKT